MCSEQAVPPTLLCVDIHPFSSFAETISHTVRQPEVLILANSGEMPHLLQQVRKGHFIF